MHAQCGVVHLGNTTNNRVENAHGRLKRRTNHLDRLVIAMQKVWDYGEILLREYQSQAFMGSRRRQRVNEDSYVKFVLASLTDYAAQKVRLHLTGRIPDLTFDASCDSKVIYPIDYRFQFLVHEGALQYEVDRCQGTCNCIFSQSMLLPCFHVLSVFRGINCPHSE